MTLLAAFSVLPRAAFGNTLFVRLAPVTSSVVPEVKTASITAKTSSRSGANGIVITAKVSGARDRTGAPANVTLMASVGLDNIRCYDAPFRPFPVVIVNGSGKATVTAADIGLPEENTQPGRTITLCGVPQMFFGSQSVLTFRLYNASPGKILDAPFILSTASSNPITSWKSGTFSVKNVRGEILATTRISGAQEGIAKSSRTIIPLIPYFDGFLCGQTPYFLSSLLLDNGNGKSTTPNLDLGDTDPGLCLTRVGLEDSALDPIATDLGIVQGVDPD